MGLLAHCFSFDIVTTTTIEPSHKSAKVRWLIVSRLTL